MVCPVHDAAARGLDNTYSEEVPEPRSMSTGVMTSPRQSKVLTVTATDDPQRDLQVALSTAASHQESIRHADTKVATIVGLQGGLLAFAVDRVDVLFASREHRWTIILGAGFVIAMVATVIVGGWYLAGALRPHVAGPGGGNRFAFPCRVRSPQAGVNRDPRRQNDEAWDLVAVLAGIARAKHARIRRGLPWMVASMISAGGAVLTATLATIDAPGLFWSFALCC